MRDRRLVLLIAVICLAACGAFLKLGSDNSVAHAQQSSAPAAPAADPSIFHAETRVVLVDAVVTDKKGNYVRDLAQKDFKVWEDGKEEAVSSFSFEDNTAPSAQKQPRYLVLFFDNSTMDMGDQAKARDAAAKFIDANAGPDRLIAIADFGGTVHISQNFTADVKGLKGSAVSPNGPEPELASLTAPSVMPSLSNAESDFGIRSVLSALRSLGKSLAEVARVHFRTHRRHRYVQSIKCRDLSH
jgi:VWFA-related protein